MPFWRSLLVTDPLVILATLVMGSFSLLTSFFDADGHRQVAIARFWARALLWVSGVKVSAEGLERIGADAVCVIASNHLSFMDTPVVLANIPLPFRFLAKRGLFRIPFLGQHLARAGHIPVHRDNPRAALKTLSQAARAIQERGISLLVFPEGGRSRDGRLQEFNEGAAYIAIKAGKPLIPIALIGTREVLPLGSLTIRPGHVRLLAGEPILTEGLTLRDRGSVTREARERIAALLASRA